jgi:hypothetical protein
VLCLYAWLHQSAVAEGQARATSFVALVVGHLTLALAVMARSSRRSKAHHSRYLWLVSLGASVLLVLTLVLPGLRQIMRFSAPDMEQLIVGLTVGIVAGGWSGLRIFFSEAWPATPPAGATT